MFAAWTRLRKLEEATSAQDEAAPLYLLDEICAEAQQGMHEVGPIVEFCIKRLTAKSPVMKQKTLRLIKYICNKGVVEFRRAMARHSSAVKAMLHYKGEPDPLKGDVPNQNVRDSARDALDALFGAETGYASAATATPQLTNRIQGFGSDSYSTSGNSKGFSSDATSHNLSSAEGILNSSLAIGQAALNMAAGAGVPGFTTSFSSGMQGFGNPKFEPPGSRQMPGYLAVSAGGGNDGGSTSLARNSPSRWGTSIRGAAGSAISGAGTVISGALSPSRRGSGGEHMLSHQAGEPRDSQHATPSGWNTQQGTQHVASRNSSALGTSAAGTAADIVERVCSTGGVRAQPTVEELHTFVEAIGELNGLQVGTLLAAKMESASWQAQLRALCATEAVIQQGSTAGCGEVAVFFQADPSAIHTAAAAYQASVRSRAQRVLSAIGAETLPEQHRAAPVAERPRAPEPDLLGGLADDTSCQLSQAEQDSSLTNVAAESLPLPQPDHHHQQQQQQQQQHPQAAPEVDLLDMLGDGDDNGSGGPSDWQPAIRDTSPISNGSDMFAGIELATANGDTFQQSQPQQAQLSPQLLQGLSLAEDKPASLYTSLPQPQQAVTGLQDQTNLLVGSNGPTAPTQLSEQQQHQQQTSDSFSSAKAASNVSNTAQLRRGSGSGKGSVFDDLDAGFRPMRPSMGMSGSSRGLASSPNIAASGVENQQQQQLWLSLDHSQQPVGVSNFAASGVPAASALITLLQQQQQQQRASLMQRNNSSFKSSSSSLARKDSGFSHASGPSASRARDMLQQMGVPDDFAPVRQERQEAAFDFVGLHINQLKK